MCGEAMYADMAWGMGGLVEDGKREKGNWDRRSLTFDGMDGGWK